MDRSTRIAMFTGFMASAMCADPCAGAELSDIVIADEVRTAYYEHAPRSLAAAMSKAVDSWCSVAGKSSKSGASSWLCHGNNPVYFRSVYVTGSKGPHGLVCENNGTSALKYFGMDLVG